MDYSKIYNSEKFPAVCNIPHGSTKIPRKFQKKFCLGKEMLEKESFELADLYAEDFFKPLIKKFGGIVSRISRLVADMERFDNDNLEPMAKKGMGVLYEKSTKGNLIRKLEKTEKKQILDLIYRPYHQNFAMLVGKRLKKFKKCLILDCHSFPAIARSYEPDKRQRNHDICLGTDPFHTPEELYRIFKNNFEKNGFKTKRNIPFSGTIVPAKYLNKNKNVFSIMIEVNRKIYMDEKIFAKKPEFGRISEKICYIANKSSLDFLKIK